MSNSAQELSQQLQFKQLALNSLLEITQAINENLSSDELFRIYEFIFRAQLGIEQLCVFYKNDEVWEVACQYGIESNKKPKQVKVEQTLLSIQSIKSAEELEDDFLQQFKTIIPVFHKEKPLAYALIGEVQRAPEVDEDALQFVQTITNIITVAIENKRLFQHQLEQKALQKELEVAANIQTSLIPESLPTDQSFEMSAIYQPHAEVGGDYYDAFWINDKELLICVGDISGKGIGAALLMANLQAHLRALGEQGLSVKELLIKLNQRMYESTKGERFVTLFLGRYHKKQQTLDYVNAGHPPPYLINDQLQALEAGTTMAGIFGSLPEFQVEQTSIHSGQCLFICSDGVTDVENHSRNRFQLVGIRDILQKNNTLSPEQLNNKVFEAIDTFRDGRAFTDDVTMLSIRWK